MKKLTTGRQLHLTKFLAVIGVVTPLFLSHTSSAADITTTNSGNWSSTTADAPWPGGVVPVGTDDVDVEPPGNVTVDTTASVNFVFGDGTITMAPSSTLTIVGTDGGQGAQSLANFDTSATGNTVVYAGNAFWCKHQNYYNLSLTGGGTLYTGNIGVPGDGQVPMTISGNMVVGGVVNIQQADAFTVNGNVTIGPNSTWDSSVGAVTMLGNIIVNGTLTDFAGGPNLDNRFNNLTIGSTGTWNLQDVIEWVVTGNLTNSGTITSHDGPGGGAQITFTNNGVITGNAFSLANVIFTGTNTVSTTITATNFVGLGGGLVFDLASAQHKVVSGTALTDAGSVTVINTGGPLTSGSSYQLIAAPSFSGTFASHSLPSLPAGLSWVDNLDTTGTISITGTAVALPVITSSQYDAVAHQFTLTWSSVPATTYSVQMSTNLLSDAFTSHVLATGVPSSGATTTKTVTVPLGSAVFLRVSQP
jgi:hypothetical protein